MVYLHPGGRFAVLDTGDVVYRRVGEAGWARADVLLMPLDVFRTRRTMFLPRYFLPLIIDVRDRDGRVVASRLADDKWLDEVLVDTPLGRYLVVGGPVGAVEVPLGAAVGDVTEYFEYRLAVKDISMEDYMRLEGIRRGAAEVYRRMREVAYRAKWLRRLSSEMRRGYAKTEDIPREVVEKTERMKAAARQLDHLEEDLMAELNSLIVRREMLARMLLRGRSLNV